MADVSGIPYPYLDPSQGPAYQDMQRKQMLAQMLMGSLQNSENSPNPSTGVSGPAGAVSPKRGMLQNVAPLVNALLANRAQKSALQSQSNYFNPPQPAQTAPYDAAAAAQAPDSIAAPPPGPGSPSNTPTTRPGLVPSRNPMIPDNMDPHTAQALMNMLGPQKYAETMVAPQYQPVEAARMGRAMGLTGDALQQYVTRAGVKANYMAPVEQRSNSIERDPVTNQVIGMNPALPNGAMPQFDQSGNFAGAAKIPGATDIAGAMTGAETAAKVANTPMMVPMGAGTEAPRYPSQIPGLGGPPGAQQPATAPGAPGAVPSSTGPRVAPPAGPAGAQPPAAAKPTDLWSTVPRLAIPNTPGQSTDTFHQKLLENAAAKHAELQNTYGQQADLADQKMQYNAEALKALPNAEVGPMSDWLTTNRQRLIEAGVPDGLIPSSGSVTPSLELNKQLTNAALQGARTTFGSRMTQNEVKLQTDEMSPSISMTRDAISSLVNQDNVKNAYTKQRAGDYQTYVQKGGDPLQFEQWYASKRPLQRFASQSQTPPAAIQRLQQNPALLPDFKKKYGWDPSN